MILLLILEFIFFEYYLFCLNCYKKSIIKEKCYKCPNKIIFKGLKIYSDDITLNEIINNNKSISRFGDGEFKIIFGEKIDFQNYDDKLSKKLIEVLNSKEKNLLIGLNIPYKEEDLDQLQTINRNFWIKFLNKYKLKLAKLINKKKNIILQLYLGFI